MTGAACVWLPGFRDHRERLAASLDDSHLPAWARRHIRTTFPSLVAGGLTDPFMLRWPVWHWGERFKVFLNLTLRNDDEGCLHDHPQWNATVPITPGLREMRGAPNGEIVEVTLPDGDAVEREIHIPVSVVDLKPRKVYLRKPTDTHRIIVGDDDYRPERGFWTLFMTGPRVREWGFHVFREDRGYVWVHSRLM